MTSYPQAREWQFDGIVGPTHNYAGLAMGNMAAASNAGQVSNPRAAALQGLEKMLFVRNLGIPQAIFPPHKRPHIGALRQLGFKGTDSEVIRQVAEYSSGLLSAVFSSSFMWAANAATVSPSADTRDCKLHITPANLTSHFHRSIEPAFTTKLLKAIFHNENYFTINNNIIAQAEFGDEGAANHMRLNAKDSDSASNIFVYGMTSAKSLVTKKYAPRQSKIASEAVARIHGLSAADTLFIQQSPEAIDHGIFHNDVIAMSAGSILIAHAQAYTSQSTESLHEFAKNSNNFKIFSISNKDLTIPEAVETYLFNSQLLQFENDTITLLAPSECESHAKTRMVIDEMVDKAAISNVHYLNVRESMRNGGGPACLRLRVEMTEQEASAIHPSVILTDEKYTALHQWITTHYRDRLQYDDLRDPEFLKELDAAYAALETILGMPGLYDM